MATAFGAATFKATGSTAARSLATRAAETFNVKDFGAVGNGIANDTVAIQAAINAAIAAPGGTVYFPVGTYKITASLIASTTKSITLRGERSEGGSTGGATLIGSFAGYIIDKPSTDPTAGGFNRIEALAVSNNHASGGAIRIDSGALGWIRDCTISAGHIGVFMWTQIFCYEITNTIFTASIEGVGIGLVAGQVQIHSCSFTHWNKGLVARALGFTCTGSRFEVNNQGLILGEDDAGATAPVSGVLVSGNSFEANTTAMYVRSCSSGAIIGNTLYGITNPTGGDIEYGMRIGFGNGLLIAGNGISTKSSIAGIFCGSGSTGLAFVACRVNIGAGTGVAWSMPSSNPAGYTFIGNDNPTNAFAYANLPGEAGVVTTPAVEGMEFDITNSNTATWGATAAAGGANHVKVRYNGTNWTVVGA